MHPAMAPALRATAQVIDLVNLRVQAMLADARAPHLLLLSNTLSNEQNAVCGARLSGAVGCAGPGCVALLGVRGQAVWRCWVCGARLSGTGGCAGPGCLARGVRSWHACGPCSWGGTPAVLALGAVRLRSLLLGRPAVLRGSPQA
jgi:hypothetical protein